MAELSFLGNLPYDIQCKILTGPLTLQQYLAARTVSLGIADVVDDCLESLVSEDEERIILPRLVLEMKRIQTISPDYPIVITKEGQLIALAKHKTLVEASFDLTKLVAYTETILPFVINFFNFYETLGNTCQDCQGRYSFTFFIYIDNERHDIVQVTEGSLVMRDFIKTRPWKTFYRDLSKKVPVCEYIGDIDYNLVGINNLPCLNKLTLILTEDNIKELKNRKGLIFNRGMIRSEIIKSSQIKEYYISYPKHSGTTPNFYYRDFFNPLMYLLLTGKDVYPDITTFFPISFSIGDIENLRNIFPNLTSIWVTRSFLDRSRKQGFVMEINRQLMKYQEIVIVNDLIESLDENYYLEIFPKELRDRITFVESDWLM